MAIATIGYHWTELLIGIKVYGPVPGPMTPIPPWP